MYPVSPQNTRCWASLKSKFHSWLGSWPTVLGLCDLGYLEILALCHDCTHVPSLCDGNLNHYYYWTSPFGCPFDFIFHPKIILDLLISGGNNMPPVLNYCCGPVLPFIALLWRSQPLFMFLDYWTLCPCWHTEQYHLQYTHYCLSYRVCIQSSLCPTGSFHSARFPLCPFWSSLTVHNFKNSCIIVHWTLKRCILWIFSSFCYKWYWWLWL